MREPSYFDRGAGRQRGAKIFHARIDMPKEFVDVGGESLGAYEIGQACSGSGERGLEVLPDLANLPAHIAFADNFALLVACQEPRNEDQPARNDRDDRRVK